MITQLRKQAIKYWEIRRVIYNILLIPSAWLSWGISRSFTYHIDDRAPASLTDPPVMMALAVLFVGANICYSTVYILEFFLMSEVKRRFWPFPGRTIILIIGCLIGMHLAGQQMSAIEQEHAGSPLPYDP